MNSVDGKVVATAGAPATQCPGLSGGTISFALYAFLMGMSDIDGVSFGEKHPTLKGRYWWRNRLADEYGSATNVQTLSDADTPLPLSDAAPTGAQLEKGK